VFPDPGEGAARPILERVAERGRPEREALLQRVIQEAGAIHLQVVPVKDHASVASKVGRLVAERPTEWGNEKRVVAWRHPLIESLGLEEELAAAGVPVSFTDPGSEDGLAKTRKEVTEAFVGVTSAEFCVAASASLVLKTRPGQPPSVSLVPTIHVAVIELHQIIADLTELYALLKWDPGHRREGLTRCLTFISGPSQTGDIEMVLINGAHGPREVHLFVITR
jgi:L-lactate dehydrogenase complex protein LldG